MAHIPIELWQIIMNMSAPKDQVVIKQLCKCLYNNILLNFDDNYINSISYKISDATETHNIQIHYIDVMKYLFKEHNCSQTKIMKIIEEIVENKRKTMQICVHQLDYLNDKCEIKCSICNYSYDCENCWYISYNNRNAIKSQYPNNFKYGIMMCRKCNQKVKALMCKHCDALYGQCMH